MAAANAWDADRVPGANSAVAIVCGKRWAIHSRNPVLRHPAGGAGMDHAATLVGTVPQGHGPRHQVDNTVRAAQHHGHHGHRPGGHEDPGHAL